MPKRIRRRFTEEFRSRAAAMVIEEGLTVSRVCADLDLVDSVLRRWIDEAKGIRTQEPPAQRHEQARAEEREHRPPRGMGRKRVQRQTRARARQHGGVVQAEDPARCVGGLGRNGSLRKEIARGDHGIVVLPAGAGGTATSV